MFLRLSLAYLIAGTTAILITLSGVSPGEPQGKTTGISSTGGLTTGSTGAFSASGNRLLITDLTEHRSADTYAYDTGTSSWQHLTGRHTAGIQFTTESWTYSGTPPSNVSSISHSESVWVEQGTEFATPASMTPGGGTAPGSVSVYGGFVATGNNIYIQTSDTGAIPSGRHLAYWIKTEETTTYNDGTPTLNTTNWGRSEVVLIKLACQDASIDTRKTYGQANKGGELPADANAPLRHMNFGNWDYKGGSFVGNSPPGSNDSSGTARLQLYVQGGSTYASSYYFASLSMYDKGKPSDSSVAGDIDTGVYFPSSSDTNLSVSPSTLTWDTKWSITPGAESSMSTDWTQHPFMHRTLTNGNSDDYVMFRLTGIAGATKPDMALYNVCLAMVSEQDIVDFQTKCWHYFASEEYQTGSTYPRNDCAPRVWVIVAP